MTNKRQRYREEAALRIEELEQQVAVVSEEADDAQDAVARNPRDRLEAARSLGLSKKPRTKPE